MKAEIKAIEYYLPPKIEDGQTLKEDNPDWPIEKIELKTGIKKRHIAAFDQTAVDMAALASNKLFDVAIQKDSIDFLILVTQSPDYVLPTSACIVAHRLGLKESCMSFDVNLGCSGFVYGLAIAGSLIEAKLVRHGLVICSETYTKYIDKGDRTCRPIFGDGASAVLLGPSDRDNIGPFELGTDGSGFKDLIVPASGTRVSAEETVKNRLFMDGVKVFMFTMDMVPKSITALLEKSKKTIADIDLFIFHQASRVVIDNIARRLEIPFEKVFVNYEQIGNTVSASIPIALKDAAQQDRLQKDDLLLLAGFGVGYSWGSCLIRWEVD